jgi:ribosomal protein S12 methylthiotransferase
MTAQVPAATRKKRREITMAAQHRIARELAGNKVGRTLKVLVEGEATAQELRKANIRSWEHGLIREADGGSKQLKGRYLVARSEADAPDIDGRVYIRGDLPVGQFANVRIVGHTDYDLIAETD